MNLSCEIITEINKENCINGREISSKCSFEIRIKPPLTQPLKCKLKFDDPIYEMRFSNVIFRVKAQENRSCPFANLTIYANNKPESVNYLKELSIYDIH